MYNFACMQYIGLNLSRMKVIRKLDPDGGFLTMKPIHVNCHLLALVLYWIPV